MEKPGVLAWTVFIIIVLTLLLALFAWGLFGLLSIPGKLKIPHEGTIIDKFTALESGTTTYHLLVNETGKIVDLKTDSVIYYFDSKIGTIYRWEGHAADLDVITPILATMLGAGLSVFMAYFVLVDEHLRRSNGPAEDEEP